MEYDTVKFSKTALCGTVAAKESKSYAHRVLVAAFLYGGEVILYDRSEDITATIDGLRTLGAEFTDDGEKIRFSPAKRKVKGVTVNCRESGTTLRFLLPMAAVLGAEDVTFTGDGRLPDRPIAELITLLRSKGIKFSSDRLPFTVNGKLQSGDYRLPGNISSQYISGLLLSLPFLPGESTVSVTTPLVSEKYIDMTLDVLRKAGINYKTAENGWRLIKTETQKEHTFTVEGDWSQAAYFLAAGAFGGPVTVTGLDAGSLQGDRKFLDILRSFGAEVTFLSDSVTVKSGELHGITIDCDDIPDLVPIIAVCAAAAKGKTVITGCGRLKFKESDRLFETAKQLDAFGIKQTVTENTLTVFGGTPHKADISSADDHRIAMAFSVLLSFTGGTLSGCKAANKSYPDFFSDLSKLGGKYNVF